MSSRSPLGFARQLPDRLSNNATEFGKGNVVLAWELSSTLDTGLCLTALNRALQQRQPLKAIGLGSAEQLIGAFGIDTLQDHLRAVTGIPYGSYAGLAKQVTGADALSYRAVLEFADLGTKSDELLAGFNSAAYKQIPDFTWVDQISVVRAKTRIDALDALMLERIKEGRFEFSPPAVINWEQGPTFAYESDTPVDQRHDFLTVETLMQALGGTMNGVTRVLI